MATPQGLADPVTPSLFELALQLSPAPTALMDELGVIRWVNAAWQRALDERGPSEVWSAVGVGEPASRFAARLGSAAAARLEQLLSGACSAIELDHVLPADRRRYRLRAVRLQEGARCHFLLSHDALDAAAPIAGDSDVAAADAAVRPSAELLPIGYEPLLRSLFEHAPIGIHVFRPDGTSRRMNPAMCRLLGVSPDVAGSVPANILTDRVWQQIGCADCFKKALGGQVVYCHDIVLPPPAPGEPPPAFDAVMFPAVDAVGRVIAVVQLARDVTAERAATEELRRAKDCAEAASRAKSTFVANVSHELRTPMNGVLGMLEVALLHESAPEQAERLCLARGAAEKLLALLDDLLDVAKMEAGKLQLLPVEFSLAEELGTTVRMLQPRARERGLTLRLASDLDGLDRVLADQGRLRQVMLNLLGNALKFTPRGEVVLRAWVQAGSGAVRTLRIAVEDTGIGIASEDIPRLFRPFEQAETAMARRFGGAGLGLAIVRELVTLMGGEVAVRSTPGQGSVFSFEIPIHLAVSDDSSLTAATAPPPGTAAPPLHILVAEDNNLNQVVASELLRRLGHQVDIVSDGLRARQAAQRQRYDLILMDLHMPAVDGIEATRGIRADEQAAGWRTPIIALTARAMAGDREACLAAGMDGHLSKPLHLAELRRLLASLSPTRPSPSTASRSGSGKLALLAQVGGDAPLAAQMVTLIGERGPELLHRLRSAVTAGEPQVIASSAHLLRGMLSHLHCEPVAEALSRLEQSAQAEPVSREALARDFARVDMLVEELLSSVPRLIGELRA